MSTNGYDVVVIGAGHNGLALAGYLARAGLTVCVLEQSDAIGGVCQTREVLPGFRGNLGTNSPHNLDPLVIRELELERYGVEWIPIPGASAAALLPGGERIIAYRDERRDPEFDQFGHGEAERYFGLLEAMNDLGRELDVSFYDAPPSLDEVQARVPDRHRELFDLAFFGTTRELLDRYLTTDQVKASLGMLAVVGNFVGPDTPGSAFSLMQRPLYRGARGARDYTKSVLGTSEYAPRNVRGGLGAVTQAMGRSAQAHGAVIRTEAPVERMIVEDGRAIGVVIAGGEEVRGRAVVSAINPVQTLRELVPSSEIPADLVDYLGGVEMEGCLAKIYVGIEGEPEYLAARDEEERQILARCGLRMGSYVDSMQAAYERAREGHFDGDPVVYCLMQTAFDDSLNPTGRHLMSMSVCFAPYHLADGMSWPEQRDNWVNHVVDWVADNHIPNLRDIIVETGGMSPDDFHRELGVYQGNALHGDVLVDTMFDRRPIPGYSDYTSPVEGLFFCSVGTWPANYMNGLGGRNASQRVMRFLGSTAQVITPLG